MRLTDSSFFIALSLSVFVFSPLTPTSAQTARALEEMVKRLLESDQGRK